MDACRTTFYRNGLIADFFQMVTGMGGTYQTVRSTQSPATFMIHSVSTKGMFVIMS
jgi:hypothetical protein